MSSSVFNKEPRCLHSTHFLSFSLLIWYLSVLLLFTKSPSVFSMGGTNLSTWFIFASKERIKVISSAYLGSISMLCLSLSITQSKADHIVSLWSSLSV